MSLTDEDKRWITELLDQKRERVETSLLELLDQKLERVETSILGLLDQKLERVETSLLTEFHKWASPNEARQRTHAAAIRALDLEMESLSDRVTKLEPPQA